MRICRSEPVDVDAGSVVGSVRLDSILSRSSHPDQLSENSKKMADLINFLFENTNPFNFSSMDLTIIKAKDLHEKILFDHD